MAHEWHTNHGTNPLSLIEEFFGFTHNTDHSGMQEVTQVKISNRTFNTIDEARSSVCSLSYYDNNTAYLTTAAPKKVSKAYQTAYANFLDKYKEYNAFKKNLTIAYGRKSLRVTCPNCDSSITLRYGGRFKSCPVCGSQKIISDSNWKILETKRRMCEKASETLSKEAEKNGVTYVCGIEWHC